MFCLFFGFFLATQSGMWDLSSLTRDWTHAPCTGSTVLTTGPREVLKCFTLDVSISHSVNLVLSSFYEWENRFSEAVLLAKSHISDRFLVQPSCCSRVENRETRSLEGSLESPLQSDVWAPWSPPGLLTFRATDDVGAERGWALAQERVVFPSWVLSIHFLHLSCQDPGLREVVPLGCEWLTLTESWVSRHQKSTRVKTLTRKFNNFLWFYPSPIYKLKSFKMNNLEKNRKQLH